MIAPDVTDDMLRAGEDAIEDLLQMLGVPAGDSPEDGYRDEPYGRTIARAAIQAALAARSTAEPDLYRMLERMETGHVDFIGADGKRIHPDWCRECRVQALKDAIADIDRHATPIGLLDNSDPEGSPHHYIVTVGALHRALGKAYTAEPCENERARLQQANRDQAAIIADYRQSIAEFGVFEACVDAIREWCDQTEVNVNEWLEAHNPECECEVGSTYLACVDQMRALLREVSS